MLVVSACLDRDLGGAVQKVAAGTCSGEDHGALSNPTSIADESLPHSHGVVPWTQEQSEVPQSSRDPERSVANLDTAVAAGEREGLTHPMTVILPERADRGVLDHRHAFERAHGRARTGIVDRFGGTGRTSCSGYDDYGTLAKAVTHGIAPTRGAARHRRCEQGGYAVPPALAVIASHHRAPMRGAAAPRVERPRAPVDGCRCSPPPRWRHCWSCASCWPWFGASVIVILVAERLLRLGPRARQFFAIFDVEAFLDRRARHGRDLVGVGDPAPAAFLRRLYVPTCVIGGFAWYARPRATGARVLHGHSGTVPARVHRRLPGASGLLINARGGS